VTWLPDGLCYGETCPRDGIITKSACSCSRPKTLTAKQQADLAAVARRLEMLALRVKIARLRGVAAAAGLI
jgi:hypothetical protein